MADQTKIPLLVKLHNATCPIRLLEISLLQKLEPGCLLASKYDETK